jgi:hypothetical protein
MCGGQTGRMLCSTGSHGELEMGSKLSKQSPKIATTLEFRTSVKSSTAFSAHLADLNRSRTCSSQKHRKQRNHIAFARTLALSQTVLEFGGNSETCDGLDAIDYSTPVIARRGYKILLDRLLSRHGSADGHGVLGLKEVFLRCRSRCGPPSNDTTQRIVLALMTDYAVDELVEVLDKCPTFVPSDSAMLSLAGILIPTGNLDAFCKIFRAYVVKCNLGSRQHQQTVVKILKKIIFIFSEYDISGQRLFLRSAFMDTTLRAVDTYHHRLLHEKDINFAEFESAYLAARISEMEYEIVSEAGFAEKEYFFRRGAGANYSLDDSLRTVGVSKKIHDAVFAMRIRDASTQIHSEYPGRSLLYADSFWEDCEASDSWDSSSSSDLLTPCAHMYDSYTRQHGQHGRNGGTIGSDVVRIMGETILAGLQSGLDAEESESEAEAADEASPIENDSGSDSGSDSDNEDDYEEDEEDEDEDEEDNQSFAAKDPMEYGIAERAQVRGLRESFSGHIADTNKTTLMTKMVHLGMSVWVDVPIAFSVNDITHRLHQSNSDIVLYYDDETIMSQLEDGDGSFNNNSLALLDDTGRVMDNDNTGSCPPPPSGCGGVGDTGVDSEDADSGVSRADKIDDKDL